MEFKKLSDVEVVVEPTESANVLIEENGVIKKAPKTAVGGAGGSEPDLVIKFNDHIEWANIDNINIASGSVDAVFDAFESGKLPVVEVEVEVTPAANSYIHAKQKIPTQIIFYGDSLYVAFISTGIDGFMNYSCRIVFYPGDNGYYIDVFDKRLIQQSDV